MATNKTYYASLARYRAAVFNEMYSEDSAAGREYRQAIEARLSRSSRYFTVNPQSQEGIIRARWAEKDNQQ